MFRMHGHKAGDHLSHSPSILYFIFLQTPVGAAG